MLRSVKKSIRRKFLHGIGFLYVEAFCGSIASSQDLNNLVRFPMEAIQSAMAATTPSKVPIKNDPLYNDGRTYEGYPLTLVFSTLGVHISPTAWIRFICRDGYAPEIPFKKILNGSPFLVIRSLNNDSGHAWEPLSQDGKQISLEPAYLIWGQPNEKPDEFPWPYQIVSIEVFNGQPESIMVADGAQKTASKGFEIFTARCLKCHSLNGYGGTMGPELMSPCGVTQYWNVEFLKEYIRKPQSIRAKARMPSNEDLRDDDMQGLIAYLGYLANRPKNSSSQHCVIP
jgi:cytochrome c2